jgi:hypothetical protein
MDVIKYLPLSDMWPQLEDACIPAHVGERAVRAGVDNDTVSLGMTMHDNGMGDEGA